MKKFTEISYGLEISDLFLELLKWFWFKRESWILHLTAIDCANELPTFHHSTLIKQARRKLENYLGLKNVKKEKKNPSSNHDQASSSLPICVLWYFCCSASFPAKNREPASSAKLLWCVCFRSNISCFYASRRSSLALAPSADERELHEIIFPRIDRISNGSCLLIVLCVCTHIYDSAEIWWRNGQEKLLSLSAGCNVDSLPENKKCIEGLASSATLMLRK